MAWVRGVRLQPDFETPAGREYIGLAQRAHQDYRHGSAGGSMKRGLFVVGLVAGLSSSSRITEMQTPNPPHFHHVHLNSTDPQKTFEFYEQVFGAKRVKFRDQSDALFTGRGVLLVNTPERRS